MRLLPACREHLAAAAQERGEGHDAWPRAHGLEGRLGEVRGRGERFGDLQEPPSRVLKARNRLGVEVRISVLTAESMVLLLDDAVATVLSFSWKGP